MASAALTAYVDLYRAKEAAGVVDEAYQGIKLVLVDIHGEASVPNDLLVPGDNEFEEGAFLSSFNQVFILLDKLPGFRTLEPRRLGDLVCLVQVIASPRRWNKRSNQFQSFFVIKDLYCLIGKNYLDIHQIFMATSHF